MTNHFDIDPYDDEDILGGITAIPVRLIGEKTEQVAPQYGSTSTWTIPQSGVNSPVQILQRRPTRYKAKFIVNGVGSQTTEFIGQNPAAGSAFVYTNSTGFAQSLTSVAWNLVTSATVANRFMQVQILDASGNIVALVQNGTAVAASGNAQMYTATNIGVLPNAATIAVGTLPNVVLQPSWSIKLTAGGLQAGDQIQSIFITFTTFVYVMINSHVEPLTLPTPVGFTVNAVGTLPDWDSQEPLYAIAVGGSASISVIDESYNSEVGSHG